MFHERSSSVRERADAPGGEASPDAAGATEPPLSDGQLLALQHAALDHTANAVVITDVLGTIQWTNPAFTALTGYSAAEAYGETPALLKSGEHDRPFYDELWRTVTSGRTWRGEFTNRRKDGTFYRGEQVITPVRSAAAGITHFVAVMNDVTARRAAEVQQQATHRQLQQLLDHSPAVIYAAKFVGRDIVPHTMSEGIEGMLGFTVAEALSYAWWLGQLHPDDRDRVLACIGETITHGTSAIEYRLRHRDGSYRWVEDNCRLVRDAAGRPAEFIGILTDITERKRAEEVLHATVARQSGRRRRRIQVDVAVLVLGALLVFLLGHRFGWFEEIFAMAADEARHPFGDELMGTLVILLPCLALFSFRRWRESRAEVNSQETVSAALRTLHAEQEARIQQRTGELARANAGLHAEVAERTRAEDALRLFRTLVDQSSDTFEVIDPATGRFLDVNDRGPQHLGCTREEYLRLRVCDVDPTIDPTAWPQIAEHIRKMGFHSGEGRHRRTDGTFFPVEFDCRWVQTDRAYIVTVVRDISARKAAEEALRNSQALYHSLVEQLPAGVFRKDPEGRYVYVNEWFARLAGVSPAAHLGRTPAEIAKGIVARGPLQLGTAVDAAFFDLGTVHHAEIMRTSRPLELEHKWIFPDGHAEFLQVIKGPVFDSSGRLAGSQGILFDVTARKEAEQQLHEQREQWRALVATSANAIFVICDELLVMVNPAAAAGFGATEAELLGRSIFDFVPAELHAETRARLQQAAKQRDPLPLREQKFCRVDGSVTDVEASSVRFRFGGKPAFLIEARDITARKQTEVALKESEERYRALVDAAPTGIFVNVDDRFAYVNQAMCQILGATAPEQLLGHSIYERFHPDCHAVIRERAGRVRFGDTAQLMDERHLRLDGSVVDVETVATRISFQGRLAVQVLANDITRRKQIENVLRESERRFRDMLANVDLVAMTLDQAGRVTFCNDALLRLTGWRRDELIGQDWFTRLLPGGGAEVKALFLAAIAEGRIPAHHENPLQTRAGERREIVWNNTLLRDGVGNFVGTASIGEDVTERNRAAAALREAKEQYQSIFQNSVEGIYQTTPGGQFRAANAAMARILGYASVEELMRERSDIGVQGYVDPSRREDFKRQVEAHGMVSGFEYEVYRKDGSIVWVSENARAVRDAQGAIVCYEGSMGDITERKRAELRLKLQHAVTQLLAEGGSLEQTTQKILEAIGRGLHWDLGEFWTVDRTTHVLRCADVWHPSSSGFRSFAAASRHFSYAPGAGLAGRVWTLGHSAWIADIAQVADCERRGLAGALGLRSWIGFPIKLRNETFGIVGFFSAHRNEPDEKVAALLEALGSQIGQFVERQQLAEQFREAQKMEAIGTLAGGIAHDFNNIIAAISGYTELAKMELGENTVVTEHLDAVQTASTRAACLVRQILAFSRQQEHVRRPVQMRHIVAEAMNLLRATIPTTIEFDFTFDRELPAVLADATQVHQVVMNLATNAWHAMKDRAGRLGVALEVCPVDAHLAEIHPGLRPGTYVRLSVSDTGRGMDAATLSRIFEPFFTTKAPGEGTGLGLAVVHGIMQTHDGVVTVYSQPGEGTMFRLYFPACADETTEAKVEGTQIPQGHGERVLYVDDEEALAKMARKVLERLGYVVDARTNAVEALEAVRANPGRYDLVITDLAMPVLTGTELAQQLLAIRPDLPVILITGYSATLTPARVQAMGIRELLSKPIAVDAMGTAVARGLAGAKSNLP